MNKKLNKENKGDHAKLFEDYLEEAKKEYSTLFLLGAAEEKANKRMLDALANKIFDLEKDNDLLRGQITELTHKMDFVMDRGFFVDAYKETLKKK